MCEKQILPFEATPGDGEFELTIWRPEGECKAVVQVLHGMAEHIERYDRMARALCAAGYAVAGHNHKGHGPKCDKSRLGYFYDRDGWNHNVENAHYVSAMLRDLFPGKKLVLLGHSMGSFMAREYALRYGDELFALVLSGTGSQPAFVCAFARLIAKLSPQKKPAKLVDKLAFGSYNKPFAPNRTAFDWLSRDNQEVDKYVSDELCGFMFTGGAFADFFEGLLKLSNASRLSDMPEGLPVLFISGDHDPVGAMGKGVKKVARQFENAGIANVTVKLYPGARHELFNETNREEVYHDLISWLDEELKRPAN